MKKSRRFSPVLVWVALSIVGGALVQLGYRWLTAAPNPTPAEPAVATAIVARPTAPASGTVAVEWVRPSSQKPVMLPLPDPSPAASNPDTSGILLAAPTTIATPRQTPPGGQKTSGSDISSSVPNYGPPKAPDPDPTLNSRYIPRTP